MSHPVTIVINAAGSGSRLKKGIPKCLLPVVGARIIEHQLRELAEYNDIVVVAGYMADKVIEVIHSIRKDIVIAINHEWKNTGTASSLKLGSSFGNENIMSIDGDLLFKSEDIDKMVEFDRVVGVQKTYSRDPVYASCDASYNLISLSQSTVSDFEWTGIIKANRSEIMKFGNNHVFPGVTDICPIPYLEIDSIEIDYPEDVAKGEIWIKKRLEYLYGN